jgi:hypothetical protein
MPSRFPGMDPFIESQRWRDFHLKMIAAISDELVSMIAPAYEVEVEERVYLERAVSETTHTLMPDVSVWNSTTPLPSGEATATLEPVVMTLPETLKVPEGYLQIRRKGSRKLVTVLEVLSPTNKSSKGGQQEYLSKREALLEADINLVEIGLLRAGIRRPTKEPLHPSDYFVFICRHANRPKVEVYHWPLRDVLPRIPIPLSAEDGDTFLNLQSVFSSVYDRSGYQFYLKYDEDIEPELSRSDSTWVREILDDPSHS